MVLAANASSWTARPARASSIACGDGLGVCSVPFATTGRRRPRRAALDAPDRRRPRATGCITSAPDVVDQRDAGGDEDLRAEVGVSAGDARRRVDDRGGPAGDQRLGAHAVDVEVVDDRDVARAGAAW